MEVESNPDVSRLDTFRCYVVIDEEGEDDEREKGRKQSPLGTVCFVVVVKVVVSMSDMNRLVN